MALIERAESQSERVAVEMTRASVRASLTTTGSALRAGRQGVTSAVAHLKDALRQAIEQKMTTGKVEMQTFGRLANGPRDVVSMEDGRVARELTKQLSNYGVTFAIEKHGDARTFHVMGRDAQAVTHALDVASRRVDDRAARSAAKRSVSDRISERVAKNAPATEAPVRTHTRDTPTRGGR